MNNNYEQLISLIEEQKVSILKNIVMDIVSEEEKKDVSSMNKLTLMTKIKTMSLSEEQLEELISKHIPTQEAKEETKKDEPEEKVITVQQAPNKSEKILQNQILEMRKKALETVIATITCLDAKDISMNKECETFTVENAYFSIGKVIPFNVPVEIPRCLAESIKEIKTHKVITLSEENQRIQKRLSNVIRVPRYNVVIQEK